MPTKSEKSKDYKFFFNSIKKAVKQCYEVDYRPTALIADAASAITNGFSEAFLYEVDQFTRVVCWQHVKRGIDKHMNLVSKDVRRSIKVDLGILQECCSPLIFDKVSKLFLEKWKSLEPDHQIFHKTMAYS